MAAGINRLQRRSALADGCPAFHQCPKILHPVRSDIAAANMHLQNFATAGLPNRVRRSIHPKSPKFHLSTIDEPTESAFTIWFRSAFAASVIAALMGSTPAIPGIIVTDVTVAYSLRKHRQSLPFASPENPQQSENIVSVTQVGNKDLLNTRNAACAFQVNPNVSNQHKCFRRSVTMKGITLSAALVVFSIANSANAGLFGLFNHGSSCGSCGVEPTCCAPVEASCCAPTACAPVCEPTCCAPVEATCCAPAACAPVCEPTCCAPAACGGCNTCGDGCGSGCGSSSCFKMPKLCMPKLKMPKFKMPKFKLPKCNFGGCGSSCGSSCEPTCCAPAYEPTCCAPVAPSCACPCN